MTNDWTIHFTVLPPTICLLLLLHPQIVLHYREERQPSQTPARCLGNMITLGKIPHRETIAQPQLRPDLHYTAHEVQDPPAADMINQPLERRRIAHLPPPATPNPAVLLPLVTPPPLAKPLVLHHARLRPEPAHLSQSPSLAPTSYLPSSAAPQPAPNQRLNASPVELTAPSPKPSHSTANTTCATTASNGYLNCPLPTLQPCRPNAARPISRSNQPRQ